jgi:hypothetical protein
MYAIFDLLIECDMVLPELQKSNEGSPSLHIRQGQALDDQSIDWYHEWQDRNTTYLRFGHLDDKHILEFPGLSVFSVSLNDMTIEYHASSHVPSESIRHLLLDQVIPRTLGQLGRLVLHASAIKLADGAGIAFLGDSGWGKSTLASSFLESGGQHISDDCLLIEKNANTLTGTNSYQGVRLLNDSAKAIFPDLPETAPVAHYSDKRRLLLTSKNMPGLPASTTLDALFLLTNPAENSADEPVLIEVVRGVEEMMSLIKQTFVLDPLDKELIAKLFKTLGDFLQTGIPIYRIRYPHKHDRLQDAQQAIRSTLSKDKSSQSMV